MDLNRSLFDKSWTIPTRSCTAQALSCSFLGKPVATNLSPFPAHRRAFSMLPACAWALDINLVSKSFPVSVFKMAAGFQDEKNVERGWCDVRYRRCIDLLSRKTAHNYHLTISKLLYKTWCFGNILIQSVPGFTRNTSCFWCVNLALIKIINSQPKNTWLCPHESLWIVIFSSVLLNFGHWFGEKRLQNIFGW